MADNIITVVCLIGAICFVIPDVWFLPLQRYCPRAANWLIYAFASEEERRERDTLNAEDDEDDTSC